MDMKKSLGLVVLAAMMVVSFAGCAGCNTNNPPAITTLTNAATATVTPTAELTAVVDPASALTAEPGVTSTEAPDVTEAVSLTEEVLPTDEPVATPTEEPVSATEPTDTVAPAATSGLTPTCSPELIATPEPINTPVPTPTPKPTATPKPTVTPTPVPAKGIVSGDYVTFGHYEQDKDFVNGKEPIEWLVLEVKEGRAFLISKYVLDGHQYHSQKFVNDDPVAAIPYEVTWETSDLRAWLGSEFLNTAFTAAEQESIVITTVKNPDHSNGTEGGNDTRDKVYILSLEEALNYFGVAENRKNLKAATTPTEYSKTRNIGYIGDEPYAQKWYQKNANWWLRSPGMGPNWGAYVAGAGILMEDGAYVTYNTGVRPALWLDIVSADVEKIK